MNNLWTWFLSTNDLGMVSCTLVSWSNSPLRDLMFSAERSNFSSSRKAVVNWITTLFISGLFFLRSSAYSEDVGISRPMRSSSSSNSPIACSQSSSPEVSGSCSSSSPLPEVLLLLPLPLAGFFGVGTGVDFLDPAAAVLRFFDAEAFGRALPPLFLVLVLVLAAVGCGDWSSSSKSSSTSSSSSATSSSSSSSSSSIVKSSSSASLSI
ncbi:hypothetical protein WICPIJ_001529 [Wickerhamomyces pijperi]|uniref:Uncharacterized protein n=1 Tax=Wickerhamomyces pijperi TaxID=599730 RepID=A0A9P8TPT6_WICPI|nr:hypothetical protein WICPIJ_001529 [Wickerhamomyces pijperi]